MKDIKLDGWVCRDGNRQSTLTLFTQYPERCITKGYNRWNKIDSSMALPKDLFPDITWDSEPYKVTLTISKKK